MNSKKPFLEKPLTEKQQEMLRYVLSHSRLVCCLSIEEMRNDPSLVIGSPATMIQTLVSMGLLKAPSGRHRSLELTEAGLAAVKSSSKKEAHVG